MANRRPTQRNTTQKNARPIPWDRSEAIAASGLIDVDISGGASIVPRDELTTGAVSKANAIAGGFTPDPQSPAGRSGAPTLLEAYRNYLARAQASERAAKASTMTPEDAEARAIRKSRKRLRKHTQEGMGSPQAVAKAFERYRTLGGKSGFAVWSRTVHK